MLRQAVLVILFSVASVHGQTPAGAPQSIAQIGSTAKPAEPFKVGTFEIDGVPRVALVLRDNLVVEIETANRSLQNNPAYMSVVSPRDMGELIGQYRVWPPVQVIPDCQFPDDE